MMLRIFIYMSVLVKCNNITVSQAEGNLCNADQVKMGAATEQKDK